MYTFMDFLLGAGLAVTSTIAALMVFSWVAIALAEVADRRPTPPSSR